MSIFTGILIAIVGLYLGSYFTLDVMKEIAPEEYRRFIQKLNVLTNGWR